MVDHQWEKQPGDAIASGEVLGSVEGFKAISDIFCIANGIFTRGNPDLRENIELVSKDPYGAGWLYELRGAPDERCEDVESYRKLLDATIDRLLLQQKSDESSAP